MKPAPIPWIRCLPGDPPLITGECFGSTAIALKSGFNFFKVTRDTGNRAPRSHAGDDGIDLLTTVFPNLWSRRRFMDFWIGWILELLWHVRVIFAIGNLSGIVDRTFHAFASRRQYQVRSHGA